MTARKPKQLSSGKPEPEAVEGEVLTPTAEDLIAQVIQRRPGTIVPISVAFAVTVRHIGDALLTDGTHLYELGPGVWRIVDNEVYERVMRAALTTPPTKGGKGN